MGVIARHVGFHYPVRYKNTERHWSRSSFRRVRRVRAPTFDIGDDTSAADPRA
jgi:hypothetical protein